VKLQEKSGKLNKASQNLQEFLASFKSKLLSYCLFSKNHICETIPR
jgi:hypothetical protein